MCIVNKIYYMKQVTKEYLLIYLLIFLFKIPHKIYGISSEINFEQTAANTFSNSVNMRECPDQIKSSNIENYAHSITALNTYVLKTLCLAVAAS